MMKKTFVGVFLGVLIAAGGNAPAGQLIAGDGTRVPFNCYENQNFLVNEEFLIFEVEGGNVRGEKVNGTGEGIFYTVEQLQAAGVDGIAPGDVIRVTWSAENFAAENWDQFNAVKIQNEKGR